MVCECSGARKELSNTHLVNGYVVAGDSSFSQASVFLFHETFKPE